MCTLSTGSILAAVVLGVLFGFGFTIGRAIAGLFVKSG